MVHLGENLPTPADAIIRAKTTYDMVRKRLGGTVNTTLTPIEIIRNYNANITQGQPTFNENHPENIEAVRNAQRYQRDINMMGLQPDDESSVVQQKIRDLGTLVGSLATEPENILSHLRQFQEHGARLGLTGSTIEEMAASVDTILASDAPLVGLDLNHDSLLDIATSVYDTRHDAELSGMGNAFTAPMDEALHAVDDFRQHADRLGIVNAKGRNQRPMDELLGDLADRAQRAGAGGGTTVAEQFAAVDRFGTFRTQATRNIRMGNIDALTRHQIENRLRDYAENLELSRDGNVDEVIGRIENFLTTQIQTAGYDITQNIPDLVRTIRADQDILFRDNQQQGARRQQQHRIQEIVNRAIGLRNMVDAALITDRTNTMPLRELGSHVINDAQIAGGINIQQNQRPRLAYEIAQDIRNLRNSVSAAHFGNLANRRMEEMARQLRIQGPALRVKDSANQPLAVIVSAADKVIKEGIGAGVENADDLANSLRTIQTDVQKFRVAAKNAGIDDADNAQTPTESITMELQARAGVAQLENIDNLSPTEIAQKLVEFNKKIKTAKVEVVAGDFSTTVDNIYNTAGLLQIPDHLDQTPEELLGQITTILQNTRTAGFAEVQAGHVGDLIDEMRHTTGALRLTQDAPLTDIITSATQYRTDAQTMGYDRNADIQTVADNVRGFRTLITKNNIAGASLTEQVATLETHRATLGLPDHTAAYQILNTVETTRQDAIRIQTGFDAYNQNVGESLRVVNEFRDHAQASGVADARGEHQVDITHLMTNINTDARAAGIDATDTWQNKFDAITALRHDAETIAGIQNVNNTSMDNIKRQLRGIAEAIGFTFNDSTSIRNFLTGIDRFNNLAAGAGYQRAPGTSYTDIASQIRQDAQQYFNINQNDNGVSLETRLARVKTLRDHAEKAKYTGDVRADQLSSVVAFINTEAQAAGLDNALTLEVKADTLVKLRQRAIARGITDANTALMSTLAVNIKTAGTAIGKTGSLDEILIALEETSSQSARATSAVVPPAADALRIQAERVTNLRQLLSTALPGVDTTGNLDPLIVTLRNDATAAQITINNADLPETIAQRLIDFRRNAEDARVFGAMTQRDINVVVSQIRQDATVLNVANANADTPANLTAVIHGIIQRARAAGFPDITPTADSARNFRNTLTAAGNILHAAANATPDEIINLARTYRDNALAIGIATANTDMLEGDTGVVRRVDNFVTLANNYGFAGARYADVEPQINAINRASLGLTAAATRETVLNAVVERKTLAGNIGMANARGADIVNVINAIDQFWTNVQHANIPEFTQAHAARNLEQLRPLLRTQADIAGATPTASPREMIVAIGNFRTDGGLMAVPNANNCPLATIRTAIDSFIGEAEKVGAPRINPATGAINDVQTIVNDVRTIAQNLGVANAMADSIPTILPQILFFQERVRQETSLIHDAGPGRARIDIARVDWLNTQTNDAAAQIRLLHNIAILTGTDIRRNGHNARPDNGGVIAVQRNRIAATRAGANPAVTADLDIEDQNMREVQAYLAGFNRANISNLLGLITTRQIMTNPTVPAGLRQAFKTIPSEVWTRLPQAGPLRGMNPNRLYTIKVARILAGLPVEQINGAII
ncbi:MAG: hypothetical protein M1366_00160 [Patescibacteria group bacterium]|nr:hypothetical protein [Patescibacteria group bacterium]